MPASSINVLLTPDTQQRIAAIALYRQEYKSAQRGTTENQRISSKTALETEIAGLTGEFAVAQHYGLEPNLSLEPDEGWDFIIAGKRVDVKYTTYSKGDLFFTSLSHFKADIALLIVAPSDNKKLAQTASIIGWIDKATFINEHLYHAPHVLGQPRTTWMGVGMTQPTSSLHACIKCAYHYAPIQAMSSSPFTFT